MLHPLNNLEIANYFNYEPRFNGVFLRNKLPRTKDGAHVINLDDKYSKVTHWFSSFINKSIAIYFDSFGIEYIPPEVLNIIKKNQFLTLTTYLEYEIMNLLCLYFIVSLSFNI